MTPEQNGTYEDNGDALTIHVSDCPVVVCDKVPTGKKGDDALVLALAMGLPTEDAAKQAKLGVATAYRRLKESAFRERIRQAKQEITERAVALLASSACEAVLTLTAAMKSKNENTRIRAAEALLTHHENGIGLSAMMNRLDRLEEMGL